MLLFSLAGNGAYKHTAVPDLPLFYRVAFPPSPRDDMHAPLCITPISSCKGKVKTQVSSLRCPAGEGAAAVTSRDAGQPATGRDAREGEASGLLGPSSQVSPGRRVSPCLAVDCFCHPPAVPYISPGCRAESACGVLLAVFL